MSAFLESLRAYKGLVDERLSAGFCRDFLLRHLGASGMDGYIDMFIRHCQGGKRLRAYLVRLGYEIGGGKEMDKVLEPSLAIEVFQTAVLAHDDIIDRSEVRRFKPSMWVELGGGLGGISRTICIGDIGIVAAGLFISESDFAPDVCLRARIMFDDMMLGTMAGEVKEYDLPSLEKCTVDDVLGIIRLKTALYTITGPLMVGRALAGARNNDTMLEDFGMALGTAFQIKDDIIGMYGEEAEIGKSALSDAREGKRTLLSVHFVANANPTAKEEFLGLYGREDLTMDGLSRLRAMLKDSGSLAYAEGELEKYAAKARSLVPLMGLDKGHMEQLNGLADYMVGRSA
ncbi:MAG: polyprenyl synthetase family protein [Rickettsiales bacterium]|jgi:geranylgeranyl pyrophosphate synthase|nr:polyprenyl synthetase family protein [Rickettsiales bacterium]